MLQITEYANDPERLLPVWNAKQADATAIFATNFYTPPMRILRRHLGGTCFPVTLVAPGSEAELSPDELEAARTLYRFLKAKQVRRLNIAGNSLATLQSAGLTQVEVAQFLMRVLGKIHAHRPFDGFVTGGRHGVELATVAAGAALGVPVLVCMPKGFMVPGGDGVPRRLQPEDLTARVALMADGLRTSASPVATAA